MSKRILSRNTSGFTLMEVIVVITILGVLATLALPTLRNSIEKSRGGEGIQILDSLLSAQRIFEFESGAYATTVAQLDITIPPPASFNNITNSSIYDSGGFVATVRRNTNTYELCIQPDGDISCDNISGSPCDLFNFPVVTCPGS